MKRTRIEETISEKQFEFLPRQSTTEVIHLLRRYTIEKGKGTCIWSLLTLRRPMIEFLGRFYGDAWRLKGFVWHISKLSKTCMMVPRQVCREWKERHSISLYYCDGCANEECPSRDTMVYVVCE